MSYFQLYEQQRELKSKLQVGSQCRWKGPEYRYNEIIITHITSKEVCYYYTHTPGLRSSMHIAEFMRDAIPIGPVVEPSH